MAEDLWGSDQGAGSDHAAEEFRTVDSALLHDALASAMAAGWLFSVSRSRDGYAVRLSVMVDGKRQDKWCDDAAAIDTALQGLMTSAQSWVAQGPRG